AASLRPRGASPARRTSAAASPDRSSNASGPSIAPAMIGPEAFEERSGEAAALVRRAGEAPRGLSEAATQSLLSDLETARRCFAGEAVVDDDVDALVARHGWFGELAAAQDDAARYDELTSGGGLLLGLLIGGGLVLVLVFLAGVVLLILAVVFAATGTLRGRFMPPTVGGSVYLETFTVFVIGFLLLQLVGAVLAVPVANGAMDAKTAGLIGLGSQWLLLLTVLWPLVRGVPVRSWREGMGLTAGRGVFREIGAGVLGYVAGIPLYVAAAAITALLIRIRAVLIGFGQAGGSGSGGAAEAPPVIGPSGQVNPVFEMVAGQDVLGIVLLGSLVVVWAPLVEELIMRGALYRHLRSRLYWLVSAGVTALLFGVLHQYDVLLLLPVISLGLVFAIVREWRVSVIGCITGHLLHNATVFGIVLTLIAVLG
ncbi:MAG: CPBP family intramembrane glutamic endopeptidase, partial [Planctomycetota bacterium]